MVYIREAHALDSPAPLGGGSNPIVEDPTSLLERSAVAQVCMIKLALEPMPGLVDDLDDSTNQSYAAWPDRMYLIGTDGKIAFHGFEGPFGFDPAELEDAIRNELAENSSAIQR